MPGNVSDEITVSEPEKHGYRRGAADGSISSGPRFVVGIGASAGGLEAYGRLLDTLAPDTGAAFILVQHLDPSHDSMMVDLLSSHTTMTVQQAADGMAIVRNNIYIIAPGTYLSVHAGILRVSQPPVRHGARLPFDFLLQSLAEEYGAFAIGVFLSGTGADGSIGLEALKQMDGFCIAQDLDQASFDGMPRSAVDKGLVDLILSIEEIPDALLARTSNGQKSELNGSVNAAGSEPQASIRDIVELMRANTFHDFSLYKQGTLLRRIERRMGLSGIATGDVHRYFEVLQSNATELELLAKDLLINVTNFFRDPKVFERLESTVIPEMVRNHNSSNPLRIWIAGCSTGEEAYSLAIVFTEQIKASKRDIKLQVFASDIDADAIASARDGNYTDSIKEHVSEDRIDRFFTKEDNGYRISSEIRSLVVFTVQDVLSDPPFSRLDLVSCRNLLIYLGPEAQVKVISLFHFALVDGGVLLLGNAETVGQIAGRFDIISKPERLYRRSGLDVSRAISFPSSFNTTRESNRQTSNPLYQSTLADLCRRAIMDNYAPAAVLINLKHECLYSLGPTELYLHVPPGHPTHDFLAMTHHGLHSKLRSAIQKASAENQRVVVPNCRITAGGKVKLFSIDVRPLRSGREELLLICFVDAPQRLDVVIPPAVDSDTSRVTQLEQELEITKTQLHGAIRDLEISGEEQKIISEEALSFNEEYQSTNEELLTSKEELQSLNEELTALNSQLQETLERQRTTSDDLQNVLYSTDVATIFLDTSLNIRFFTPATKALFNVIPADIGRPLADLHSLAADADLLIHARAVLKSQVPLEKEIKAESSAWYTRRILPYRTQNSRVEGVVITFEDITHRKHAADALEAAKRQAELANTAKSRFLAAASHDLRQPLQTLTLLQGLLASSVQDAKSQNLVARFDATLGAMSSMLNTLLDINQIEAGTVRTNIAIFPINNLLDRLANEFTYMAEAKGLSFRVVPCSLDLKTDPHLLEQMVRNLISNALKYTLTGKVLLGCRRREGRVSIEIWDTGIGIPEQEHNAIFEEYHQLDNSARQRTLGLGLGLAIVRRLGTLLGHLVQVRSIPGMGSVFSVEVVTPVREVPSEIPKTVLLATGAGSDDKSTLGTILIIEDDTELRELIEVLLKGFGHAVLSAPDGVSALALITDQRMQLDLVLADYNLPNDMNGLQVASRLRTKLNRDTPVLILTGDISTETLRDISRHDCSHLNKPVKPHEMNQAIQLLLTDSLNVTAPGVPELSRSDFTKSITFVVDDDRHIREAVCSVLENDGHVVRAFASSEEFLTAYQPGQDACLLVDAYLPGMSGIELLQLLKDKEYRLPSIMMTGNSDVSMAVNAMKAGASDFIEKPIGNSELLACVARALDRSRDENKRTAWHEDAAKHLRGLTDRQREIMHLVLAGHPSKNIAADLGISQRTVENHRASIMKKTGSKSLPALARLVLAATAKDVEHLNTSH